MLRRRTKILATLGPASDSSEQLRALMAAGMDAVRLNFSHGTSKEHEARIQRVREAAAAMHRAVPLVQDIQGPKIRVGDLPKEGIRLVDGESLLLRVGEEHKEKGVIPVTYAHLAEDTHRGALVYMDDGYIQTQVEEVLDRETVRVKVIAGGLLKSHKGVNFPGVRLSIKFPTEKDKHDLRFGQEMGVDYVAASFVRSAADLARVRAELDDDVGAKVIAKVELREAIENLEEIVLASDGIMVARGDLGVELPPEDVPAIQKRLITMCDRLGTPVITATQMLESMIEHPRPTRAEAADVYNAVLDGTSAVMLSGETAVGRFPIDAVATMGRIAAKAEEALLAPEHIDVRRRAITQNRSADAMAHAAVRAAEDLDVAAIVTLTSSGSTARYVSKYKPRPLIIAATPSDRTLRQVALLWGVTPLRFAAAESEEDMLRSVDAALVSEGLLRRGDRVIITSGQLGVAGTTNQVRVATVGAIGRE